jgi:asparagine synthase (glutamine-hydrolysing)
MGCSIPPAGSNTFSIFDVVSQDVSSLQGLYAQQIRMPGIVGLITRLPRAWVEPQLLRMVDVLRHESFYVTGTWIDESLGVYVGWTVRKNSFSDSMPLLNETGDVCLVFSGEDYPEPGTAARLRGCGHLLGKGSSSYLVHLFEDQAAFPAGLNGMFHGIGIDRRLGAIKLFNDRYGMHRLSYHESPDAFYFASESKAILAARPELRTPDPRGLGDFVACSCVLENRTIFKDIQVLPPASAWVFRNGSIERKDTYFRPDEWERQAPLAPEPYYQELREVLSGNLRRYFNGHERVGMTLTGGLDTRVIMALQNPPPRSLPCYTFGGMLRDCQDVHVARRVARVCQQSHEVITVGDEFLSRFSHYAERGVYLTEGGIDISRSSDLYVSERAREIAPVKVVGTYGSEIIRHAVMFKPMAPMPGLYRPEFLSYVNQAGDAYAGLRREHPVTFAAFRQSPWSHYGVLALEQSQLTVRSPYLDNDFVRAVFRAPKAASHGDVRLRLIRDGNPALARIRTDHGIGGDSGPLAASVSRFLLDFLVKAEYAYDYGMPQWVASVDHMLAPLHLERLFLGRHKLLHFRLWYRDSLSDYVRQMLLDSSTLSRPYLERKSVEAMVCGHLKGDRNHTTEIHKLITLELLHRLFLDPK